MEESLKWLLTNFQQVSVAGLLALIIVGRFFEWWVDRPTYRKCQAALTKFETEADVLAKANAAELSDLRKELAELHRAATPRRRQ